MAKDQPRVVDEGVVIVEPDEVKTKAQPSSGRKMVLCWWHLRKRCYESMSSAGGAKDCRGVFEKELLGQLWVGEVEAAIGLLRTCLGLGQEPSPLNMRDMIC